MQEIFSNRALIADLGFFSILHDQHFWALLCVPTDFKNYGLLIKDLFEPDSNMKDISEKDQMQLMVIIRLINQPRSCSQSRLYFSKHMNRKKTLITRGNSSKSVIGKQENS